ncbi:hypothetical protein Tco_1068445 [Tanacetum coccineum]|uniref:CCHC-type domain-containing protein n=1 Tax=Tanacetum coccineum TaxID=301880 RepID=A0ABQ5HFR5_9ASTR
MEDTFPMACNFDVGNVPSYGKTMRLVLLTNVPFWLQCLRTRIIIIDSSRWLTFVVQKRSLEDKILVPKPPRNCARCGTPVDGPYCQGCALLRKKFKEDLFTYGVENEFFEDLQDTSESSDDNTNVVNAPQEPIVVNQDPGENSSPSPLHIDHCCHECGDSLDGIFCRQCTCKSCGKGAHYGYNCPPKVPIISNPEPCKNQTIDEPLQNLQSLQQQCLLAIQKKEEKKRIAEEQVAKDRYWKIPICYDDDEDNTTAITPVLPILQNPITSLNNPTPSSEVVIKSTSTFPNLFLEETNTFDNSIPESETFCFNLEEISSGSPTTHSELSLPDYKAFYVDNDHFKERSSGSTTTHAEFSQYDSFIFDLSINPFPPADRSDFHHKEFADGLAHIISPPEYDHFCFKLSLELGNLTCECVNAIFQQDNQLLYHIFSPVGMKISFLIPASQCINSHCRVIPKLRAKFQSEWSSFKALLWRGRTTIGSPRSPDIPHEPINSSDGSSIATLNKRFMGGTPCLS